MVIVLYSPNYRNVHSIRMSEIWGLFVFKIHWDAILCIFALYSNLFNVI